MTEPESKDDGSQVAAASLGDLPVIKPVIGPVEEPYWARWFRALESPEMWIGYAVLQVLLAFGSIQLQANGWVFRSGPFNELLFVTAVAHMQCTLAALWIAWGPGRFYIRIPLALAWIAAATVAAGTEVDLLAAHCIAMFPSAAVATLVFTVTRWFARFRLWRMDKEPPAPRRLQYSLRHLLVLMFVVGVCCVTSGALYDKVLANFHPVDWIGIAAFSSLGTYWSIGLLPLPFVVFGMRRQLPLWIGIAGCTIWVVVWMLIGARILDFIFGPSVGPIPPELWVTFINVGLMSAAGMLGSLLFQRAIAYRLLRIQRGDAK